jgi:flagellar biosynthesis protein FlhA
MSNGKKALILAGVVVVGIILLRLLPAVTVDILITLNLLFSILIVFAALKIKKALDFPLLPTALLLITVFSLTVSISSARLILTEGAALNDWLIKPVASLIADSGDTTKIIICFEFFIILITFAAIIIEKGVTRLAEVAVRFTLDSLPCKQMAIDAEFASGAITKEECEARKTDVIRESDFYGAMDGAGRFISGSFKFQMFIIAVIIIGGIIVDTSLRGEEIIKVLKTEALLICVTKTKEVFVDALKTYVPLSIGGGFCFIFPPILLSLAMGCVILRVNGG